MKIHLFEEHVNYICNYIPNREKKGKSCKSGFWLKNGGGFEIKTCSDLFAAIKHPTSYFLSRSSASGGRVIGAGVHIYICLWAKKYLNRTLAIDSPFQTFAVGLLVEFIN